MIKPSVLVAAAVMAALPITMAQAGGGTFLTSHDLGWGGAENADCESGIEMISTVSIPGAPSQ